MNELAMKRSKGKEPKKVWLDEDDRWTKQYFWTGGFKSRRREMFFIQSGDNWVAGATKRPNEEPIRPKKHKKPKAGG